MDGTSDYLLVLAWVLVILAVVSIVIIRRVSEAKKLRREPLEEFVVVFEVRWTDSKSSLRAQEVNLADYIYLVIGRGTVAGSGSMGWSSGRRVYLGKVVRAEHGIIEVQGQGRMYKGAMVPELGSANTGVSANDWYKQLTKTPSGLLMGTIFEASVLEVRPAREPSRIRLGAIH